MRKTLAFLAPAVIVLLFASCAENDANRQGVMDPSAGASSGTFGVSVEGVTVVEGQFGTGSMYALFCPADWNGDLVLYAHGYFFPSQDVQLPNVDDLRDALLEMGYGVAYSSYPETGYAVKEAVANTHQLRGLYASKFKMPDDTFVVGHSMGGLISVMLAERYPGIYDGALPLFEIIGGTKMAFEYLYNIRVLFDYFYPGVLPGDAQNVPPGLDENTVVDPVFNAILANPLPAFELGGVSPVDIQFANPNELINAIVVGLMFHAGSWADMVDRSHSYELFDNMDVVYSGSSDDVALNAGVGRFEASPNAGAYMRNWYEPRGRLKIPIVTLHTSRDQVAQVFHQNRYEEIVGEAGSSYLLNQHTYDRFGHCTFALEEELEAFAELVAWAESLEDLAVMEAE
jgi:pimeloyl-ACP methyl ester carboxylesterase